MGTDGMTEIAATLDELAAKLIYQRNLDAVSQALWADDLAVILDHISLPNHMLTEDAEFIITSPDEMLLMMTDFREAMVAMGADSYLRLCRHAAFVPGHPKMITGLHDTMILRAGQILRPPYLNEMTLMRTESGTWKGVRVEARARNADWQIISPDLAIAQRQDLQRAFQALSRSRDHKEAAPDAQD